MFPCLFVLLIIIFLYTTEGNAAVAKKEAECRPAKSQPEELNLLRLLREQLIVSEPVCTFLGLI